MKNNENPSSPTRMHKRINTKLSIGYEKCVRRLTEKISSLIFRYRSERFGVGDIDSGGGDSGMDLYRWSNSK